MAIVNSKWMEAPVLKSITVLFLITNISTLLAERRYDKVTDPSSNTSKRVYWNGIKIKKYKNGKTRRSRTYKEGRLHGAALKFNKKGIKIREKQYKSGRLDGIKKTFRNDGSLKKVELYQNGKLHGKTVWYRKDGKKVKRTIQYQNGIRNGVQEKFYSNGNLKSKALFRIGQNGKEQRNGTFVMYYSDQKLYFEVLYVDGKKDGLAKKVFHNGVVKYEKCYIKGKEQAGVALCKKQNLAAETITRNYKNGKPSVIYQVKDGKRHGKYRRYNKEGKLTSVTQYEEGKKINTTKIKP